MVRLAARTFLAITLAGPACSPAAPELPARPNWLVIAPDSLRADRLDPEVFAGAPHLAGLASRGTWFREMVSQGGWTAPALAALLTGRYPPALEVRDDALAGLPADGRTLPEILAAYGYHTAAAWAGTFPRHGAFDRGFLETDAGGPTRPAGEGVVAWLEGSPPEPFFLLVHEVDLHFRADLKGTGAATRDVAAYDAAVTAYDRVVGTMLEALDRSGLGDRTVVVLTSNHGEDLAEHGPAVKHGCLYDSCLRVPLVILDPGQAPVEVPAVVQTVDLAPTVLARSGIPLDRTMDGHPLLPLPGGPPPDRPVFSLVNGMNASRRTREGKLILCGGRWSACAGPAGDGVRAEYYRLREDPLEQRDVLALHPEVGARDGPLLAAWLADRSAPGGLATPDDPALKRSLAEFGYWRLVEPAGGASSGTP